MNAFQVFLSLNMRKQIIATIAVVATIAAMSLLVKQTLKPQMDLLYSGLDGKVAGEVIAELAAKNVAYEVRGSAIYAQADKRDSLRLELAKEGLPRQSIAGYELFDDVNSFAMTSDMFDTAYWRAKEGELARTILALPSVDLARVHLGAAKRSRFSGAPAAQSASVTLRSSGGINMQTAKAVQYLTALSVAGLNPSDVVVIDAKTGIVAGPGSDGAMIAGRAEGGLGGLERAAAIKKNLLSLLEARVGSGNVRVSVTLDIDRKSETTTQRTFDPEARVIKSQTISEITDTSTGTSAAVGVASNLPEGENATGTSNANRGETTETIQYEISELIRNSKTLPGAIKRMSVAVLINDVRGADDTGAVTYVPRAKEELTALRELSLASAGIDAERGDVLTLKSFAFETPDLEGALEMPSAMSKFIERYLWSMVQAGFLGLIVLALGMFVIKPLLGGTAGGSVGNSAEQALLGQMELPAIGMGASAIPGLPAPQNTEGRLINAPEDPAELLKNAAQENPDGAISLLSSWLEAENSAHATSVHSEQIS
ncbi:MAG: flagellar M-ring protein FliF [Robiginitomaculum sp.]|nr:flagellar M-ring protein FliF [Robiginitomaculum sp.]